MKPPALLITLPTDNAAIKILIDELDLSDSDTQLAYTLFDRNLPPLVNTTCIPLLLGVSPRLVHAMAGNNGKYYRQFTLRKRSGRGVREIHTPRRFLKLLQTWILHQILYKMELPGYITGFEKGQSILKNARVHQNHGNILCLDIKEFFPSIATEAVARMFRERFGYPVAVSWQLAGLCTLNGRLPQGAPTSPAVANRVFLETDERLYEWARQRVCLYTRYADDLTFSRRAKFGAAETEEVRAIVEAAGFTINSEKTRILGRGRRQLVTGLVVNERARAPRPYRRKVRATLHRAACHPDEFAGRVGWLRGIVAFVSQYDPDLAAAYADVLRRIEPTAEG